MSFNIFLALSPRIMVHFLFFSMVIYYLYIIWSKVEQYDYWICSEEIRKIMTVSWFQTQGHIRIHYFTLSMFHIKWYHSYCIKSWLRKGINWTIWEIDIDMWILFDEPKFQNDLVKILGRIKRRKIIWPTEILIQYTWSRAQKFFS